MKALLVIAPDKFRDEEYFHTKEELENAGVKVVTASKAAGACRGMLGGTAKADIAVKDAKAEDYDCVAFIGGGGSSVFFNDAAALDLAKKASDAGKITGAICIAPIILANAGLLKGKKATVFPGEDGDITRKGCTYTGEPLTVDGKLITADGPRSARAFGKALAKAMK